LQEATIPPTISVGHGPQEPPRKVPTKTERVFKARDQDCQGGGRTEHSPKFLRAPFSKPGGLSLGKKNTYKKKNPRLRSFLPPQLSKTFWGEGIWETLKNREICGKKGAWIPRWTISRNWRTLEIGKGLKSLKETR